MIYTVSILVSSLVLINFLLLAFSSNKTKRAKRVNKPYVIRTKRTILANQLVPNQLAPTGS